MSLFSFFDSSSFCNETNNSKAPSILFSNASLFYCKDHDCLRVVNDFEDSVLLNGVKREDVNNFIEKYIEYVLEDNELKDAFKLTTTNRVEKEVFNGSKD